MVMDDEQVERVIRRREAKARTADLRRAAAIKKDRAVWNVIIFSCVMIVAAGAVIIMLKKWA